MFKRIKYYLMLRKAIMMADAAHEQDGHRYYVMPTQDGKLAVMDRTNFRILKRKGYINRTATVTGLLNECFYHTAYANGNGKMPDDVRKDKRRVFWLWVKYACKK